MTLDIVARGRKRPASPSGRQTVVLASASEIRARMLLHAGISFETAPADIDEAAVKLQARQSQTQIDNAAGPMTSSAPYRSRATARKSGIMWIARGYGCGR